MDNISGELILFHAGSLSVPMQEISVEFNKIYPEVKILAEPAGSLASARKISDSKRDCDILASADYAVIEKIIIPEYADWDIKFASNEMAIVYSEKSRYAESIHASNWYETLMDPLVSVGRADQNSDPCGYRTIMTLQLAENHYKIPGLAKNIMEKDREFIRPKEIDMLELLYSGSIDYCFFYRSIALQHNLKYLTLPDEVNLKNPGFQKLYASVKVEIYGNKPWDKQEMTGEPIIYGLTVLRDAPNRNAAEAFVAFMLSKDKGMRILEKSGQPSVIPMPVLNYQKLPEILRPFAEK